MDSSVLYYNSFRDATVPIFLSVHHRWLLHHTRRAIRITDLNAFIPNQSCWILTWKRSHKSCLANSCLHTVMCFLWRVWIYTWIWRLVSSWLGLSKIIFYHNVHSFYYLLYFNISMVQRIFHVRGICSKRHICSIEATKKEYRIIW